MDHEKISNEIIEQGKIFCLIICLSVCLGLMAGCGKNDDVSEDSGADNTETTEDTAEEIEEETGQEEGNTTVSDEPDSMKLYEDFLSGSAELSIADSELSRYDESGFETGLDTTKTYNMEDFLRAFFTDEKNNYDNDYSAEDLSYAYIDCDRDGTDELVLQFESYMYSDEYNNIMVIKNIDGQLELGAYVSDGYRSYNYINSYGIIGEGGSGGASDWVCSYYGIDETGKRYLIYSEEDCGCYNLYLGDEVYPDQLADELGVDDIFVSRYAFEEYGNSDYDEESYLKYLGNCDYTFGRYSEIGDMDQSDELYADGSSYVEFMNQLGFKWHKPDEMQQILEDRLSGFGYTQEMLSEDETEWTKWQGHDDLFAEFPRPAQTSYLINPGWEYYYSDYPYEAGEDFVTMEEISHESGGSTDNQWLDSIGAQSPFSDSMNIIDDPSGLYTYSLSSAYGEYDHMYDTILIHNNLTGEDEVKLDLYDFTTPDQINVDDASFVYECVEYVQTVDDVVYVSIAHRTYAESAPQNAYVMALDKNADYAVIWKSDPLVCNSSNFAIVDGSIICGYGFTAEDDYIYELNRYTGEKMNTVNVASAPEYFFNIDGTLYVRTYNTDYVYKLGWG